MNKANECTCPSGDGSLVHPCPAHPAVEQACWDERKLSDLGNELHNLSCSIVHENEKLAEQIGGIARELWNWPQACAALAQPSPAHPAPVEQAGGDERDFQAKGAQEVPSPVSKEYDRHLIGLLRKGEALPGHQEEAADEIERLRDWNDHLNNTVLPNILNPNFLMLMKGGERLLDLCTKDGEFIGVSLNDMKDVFDWMVTHARIAPDQAALAQPSPKCATCGGTGMVDDGEITCSEGGIPYENGPVKCVKDCPDCKAQPSPAQAEQAEAERPEAVAWQYRVTAGPQTGWSLWHPGKGEEFERSYTVERRPLMTVAQHERIVGELRAVIAQLRQHKNDYMDSGQETYRALQNEIREREAEIARLDGLVSGRTAERDAALARVAELEAKLSYPTAVHQWQFSNAWFDGSEEAVLKAGKEGSPIRTLYTAPAQAQHSVPDGVTVNPEALRQVVRALVGPAHHIRELQVTASLPGSPITELVKQYNAWAAGAGGKEGV
ncbi:hypothetical protein [Pseudomonas aeruginosa]|uniref:hypothetical protein n=1 Tax=Pseudomonas aeruginosa TaxID=287 RepID=UPI00022AADD9|nr:hypothetical protein [Pseudomonas aeruginosa]MCA4066191.1 hypothetical protein [Pseudomonas aeruginosa]BAK89743.1 hypothetical protein NCGM2_2892 [Pseudomonas aeruginosa NCGM2.S1]HBO2405033.1 hypothetical protein [Pseudomonas aeruginosa]HBO5009391.1 hypothetical protein [Pseudomonas aeruginosa]HCF9712015.1 hypothetical protein [Pseudomonas aeruginosa]